MTRKALLVALVSLVCTSCGSGGESSSSSSGKGGSPSSTTASGAGGASTSSGDGSGGGIDFVTSSGSEGSGDAGLEDAACAVSNVAAKLTPANILFVIDRSGSMNCNPPPLQSTPQCENNPTPKFPMQATKWAIITGALKTTIASMTPTTRVGISYFNSDDYCGVKQTPNVALGALDATQIAALDASIDGTKPKGATPIIGGVTLGYAHLHQEDLAPGNDFLVLLTDGAETCAPELKDTMIAQTVPDARSVNIRTFVIGAPGSEPARAFLSQIAYAGGTARDAACVHGSSPADVGDCHFDMTDPSIDFATALNAALQKISGEALSCELDVPSSVGGTVDYDKVNVTFTPGSGMPVPLFQDNAPCASGSNGWQYNATKTKIELCGDACKLVKSDALGAIAIALGCSTQVAQ